MISYAQFSASVLPFTLKYEGYYANVANDKGGETYRGITRKNNPTWRGWAMVDKAKPLKQNQAVKEAESAVVEFYWNRFTGNAFDKLNSVKVALAMFDYNVHGGFSSTVLANIIKAKWGTVVLNPNSGLSFVNSKDENAVVSAILDHREAYLKGLIAKNPTQKKFEEGWFKRLAALRVYVNLKTIGISAGVVFAVIAIIFFLVKKGSK